ncbi:MAG: putative periplasmic pentaheme cytochrome c [Deltaproteobacteria bacterium]|nr:putative periplasmic pentaheme cytochrome c [Deltaproteobacteria bacterium]
MKTKAVLTIVLCWVVAFSATLYAGSEAPAAGPSGSTKGKMPGKVLLGSLAAKHGPVKFDHEQHVGTAGSCAECHHQHGSAQAPSCGGCHTVDASSFRKNVNLDRIRPCGECHPASYDAGKLDRPTLAAAYHRACIKCHREVGSVGTDPKGCAEMCHENSTQARAR